MMHFTNELALENQAQIQEAIAAVQMKKYTIYAAAHAFNILKRTDLEKVVAEYNGNPKLRPLPLIFSQNTSPRCSKSDNKTNSPVTHGYGTDSDP